ncbi:hypothetical protein [Pseudotabrizicola algicola]|uniref:G5 domain-containing protein n=1 Tax=Pseudotabrizicola algicola TaxID=2709381 RepID=A0A6B3RT52_9RHOB|nr:hypothetical protein [Pseudotabrizicola algicola]NEX46249.1 hypothetical protein [Pseudotabrizicola algicola]
MFKVLGIAATALAIAVAPVAYAKPLNAGKNGIKSNAGGGNGTEDQIGATTTNVVTTTSTTTTTDTSTGEPVVVSTTTTTQETGRVVVDTRIVGAGKNKPGNLQTTYAVTYDVYTTVGTETVKTTETYLVTETTKTNVTTTDVYDIDPGRSQDKNQAPEGQPEDIVVVGDSVTTEFKELIDTKSEVVTGSSTTVTGTTTETVVETTPCNNEQCN